MYGVSHVENLEFRWGRKKGGRFYESFFYDNEQYSLYDCIYIFEDGVPEPHIGKIIEIWENPDKSKEVKLLWFLRPSDISNLFSVEADEKELFLASGVGEGLTDINPLEAISGKCSIVCTSKDIRNLQPSVEEIKMADFVFHRTFDVGKRIIKDKIDETIAGIGVNHFFNQSRFLESCSTQKYAENLNDAEANAVVFSRTGFKDSLLEVLTEGFRPYKDRLDNAAAVAKLDKVASSVEMLKISNNKNANDAVVLPSNASDYDKKSKLKKDNNCIVTASTTPRDNLTMRELLDRANRKIDKLKSRNAEGKLQVTSSTSSLKCKQQTEGQKFEVTPCPDDERKKWFMEPPWEEILQDARKDGTLVLLQNLDPSYTSEEVKDIVYHAFGEMCTAKMIQQTGFLSPYTGQALVELSTRELAGQVLKKLEELCLLLPNGRPLVASVPDPCFSREQNRFAGHLNLNNIKMPPEMI